MDIVRYLTETSGQELALGVERVGCHLLRSTKLRL